MTEITAAFQAFGPTGAILVAAATIFKFIWPDVRDTLRAQTAAFRALADLAARTDQRLANIERTTAETNEAAAILLDRATDRRTSDRRQTERRAAARGVS
jgi:hypothetical protein